MNKKKNHMYTVKKKNNKRIPLDWHLLHYLGECYKAIFPNTFWQNCNRLWIFLLEALVFRCALILSKPVLLWISLLRCINVFFVVLFWFVIFITSSWFLFDLQNP